MKEFEGKPIEPRIERFVPKRDLASTARLYAEVFAGPPWNEYTRCLECKEFFGLQTKPRESCAKCGNELSLAYPIVETKQYISDETSKTNATAFVMKENKNIIGFVWGYSYPSVEDFVNEKYRTPEMKDKIKDVLAKNNVIREFFYFSECGVRIDKRENGFSNLLSGLLIQEGRKTLMPIIMRTNWKSPMVAVAQRFQMRQIMGPMIEIDKAKKIIIPKKGAVNNFTDIEIEERVLFVLQ